MYFVELPGLSGAWWAGSSGAFLRPGGCFQGPAPTSRLPSLTHGLPRGHLAGSRHEAAPGKFLPSASHAHRPDWARWCPHCCGSRPQPWVRFMHRASHVLRTLSSGSHLWITCLTFPTCGPSPAAGSPLRRSSPLGAGSPWFPCPIYRTWAECSGQSKPFQQGLSREPSLPQARWVD